MIPHVTTGGRSFKGAFQYYMQDPRSNTRDRVEWTDTVNMLTTDPDKAWKVMAYTTKSQDRLKQASGQKATGRKTEKPVMAYSLAWHPDHTPDRDHMSEVAIQSLKALGLSDHEAVIIAHRDTPHKHVHVVVNRIHPITGLVASSSHTKRKLSEFAREYMLKHDMDYCPKRDENRKKRENGEKPRYNDPKIQQAWDQSTDGKGFADALAVHGYALAQGRKRLVVVDPYGKTHNPVRQIEGIKAKEFNARMADIDKSLLRDADEVAKEAAAKHAERKRKLASEKNALSGDFAKAVSSIPPEANPATATQQSENKSPSKQEILLLAALQQKHFQEQADLSMRFRTRIQKERNELLDYYDLRMQKREIFRLQEKCKSPSIWRKIFGLNRRDREKLHELKLGYRDAKNRFEERIGYLDAEYTREVSKLRSRQEAELARVNELAQEPSVSQSRRSYRDYISGRKQGRFRGPS